MLIVRARSFMLRFSKDRIIKIWDMRIFIYFLSQRLLFNMNQYEVLTDSSGFDIENVDTRWAIIA
jgi:hypothetical protein